MIPIQRHPPNRTHYWAVIETRERATWSPVEAHTGGNYGVLLKYNAPQTICDARTAGVAIEKYPNDLKPGGWTQVWRYQDLRDFMQAVGWPRDRALRTIVMRAAHFHRPDRPVRIVLRVS